MSKHPFPAITFTNYGYIQYTKNLIGSIAQNDINLDLRVFCIDDESENDLTKMSVKVERFENQFLKSDKLVRWDDKNFGAMMLYKFEMIYKYLLLYDSVLYLDSDIVIKKNIEDYLCKNLENKDILFQNDTNPRYPNKQTVCAGFMHVKSNRKTLKFFNPENLNVEKIINYTFHDQTHINKNKSKFRLGLLPLNEFSSGIHFYNNFGNYSPAMIHFNYVVGNKKIETIKKYGEWYI